MSFKSRDLTVKLSGEGEGEGKCGCTATKPDCGNCTNTHPNCGQCSAPTGNVPNCTDTATPRCTEQTTQDLDGADLALLRQQLQETLGASA
jgi:hypothetical protein